MVARRITLDRFRKEIGALPGALHGAAMRGLRKGAERGVEIIREEIEACSPFPPIDTKRMIDSAGWKPTATGVALFVDAPHAVYMEEGTRPHMPPVQPLAEWAARKFGLESVREARSVGYAIALKIAADGTKPRRFFRRAMRRTLNDVMPGAIRRELRALARRRGG